MYLHIHLPAFIDNIHGWQVTTSRFRLHLSLLFSWWVDAVVNHTREHACQYKEHVNTQGIHRSREQGCAKPGSMIHTYIHTYIPTIIPRTGVIVMINVGLAQACPNNRAVTLGFSTLITSFEPLLAHRDMLSRLKIITLSVHSIAKTMFVLE